jgi:hypothetical protein
MPDAAPGSRGRDRKKIPRIEGKEAARIYERCTRLDDGLDNPLGVLSSAGFDKFVSQLDERILQLAVQPDSWGERTRAQLISEIIVRLTGVPTASWSVTDIANFSNVLLPCFLLELGRRRQHVQVEFPQNPCAPDSRFTLKAGLSHPSHRIKTTQLVRLVVNVGEELVGLCYFGDQISRAAIEAQLAFGREPGDQKPSTMN